jgi:hypothetical protein
VSDPVLDALNAAAQRGGAAPAPAQAMSAPAFAVSPPSDPVLVALQQRAVQPDPASAPPPAPTRGFLDQTGDFLSAGIHHLAKPIYGASQLLDHGISGALNLLPDNPLSRWYAEGTKSADQGIANNESGYQADTPNSTGAYMGATAGTVAPLLVGGVSGGLQAAGDAAAARAAPYLPRVIAPIASKVISGATQGAIVGATQPVTTAPQPMTLADLVAPAPPEPSFWDQKADQVGWGAATGGAVPLVTAPIGAAWNAGKSAAINSPFLNPKPYAAAQVAAQLGADAPAVASDLANAPSYVPGSVPTSAQAGADPRLVMMEKALATANPKFQVQLQNRNINNNAARWDVVNGVAQTPQALQDAIAQRAAVTGPMRDFSVTNGNPVPVDGVQSAISSVANGPLGVRPTIGGATSGMQDAVGAMTTTTPANTLTNTPATSTAHPAMLDALRQNANDYLSKYSPQGFVGTQEQAAVTPIKGAIVDAINDANPGHSLPQGGWGQGLAQAGPTAPSYRDYLSEFAKRSVPINTMEVGANLADALGGKSADASGTPLLTLGNYTGRLAAALQGSDYAIDPVAQAALDGVQSDLQRATISSSLRAGGGSSETAYNNKAGTTFLDALGADGDPGLGKMAAAGAAGLLATGSPQGAAAAAFGAQKLGMFASKRVSSALGGLLMDPQKLADALTAGTQGASLGAPSAWGRVSGQLSLSAAAALARELTKSQTPQVVGSDPQKAQAYQP